MDEQRRRRRKRPRYGQLMKRGGGAHCRRDQRKRSDHLRVSGGLGDALHYVRTLDAQVPEQANNPISRDEITLAIHAYPRPDRASAEWFLAAPASVNRCPVGVNRPSL
jgi:hypothetical protein